MKRIGMLGGMSWESTVEYYKIINEEVKSRLGGLHSANCLLHSVDFGVVESYMRNGQWDDVARILIAAAKTLENGGADFIITCTNTMHKLADQIQNNIGIPLLHIADATADEIKKAHIKTVGLLGTRPTMEMDFYRSKLKEQGIEVIIPDEEDRAIIHQVIFEELCLGMIREQSKQEYLRIMDIMISMGAEGIILGCTEIPLLIQQADVKVPLFNTTHIHAIIAVEKSLES
ncbi:aspartate racemase [Desulfuribacillus stibiiarsenatis]|uniref:Aspartate racemase n=1 Tax=Desulfuribacillus stibiiarsenatis TaxID=1390249 RepID=A0A1E5L2D6_9FIRM|nr:aspartate/glutamate racemase family protein [Desulfuribacillus stibiiarsenatis]OEH84295.1 aspartate racemase [Desulfuribacillus stibiiarsenatis]